MHFILLINLLFSGLYKILIEVSQSNFLDTFLSPPFIVPQDPCGVTNYEIQAGALRFVQNYFKSMFGNKLMGPNG